MSNNNIFSPPSSKLDQEFAKAAFFSLGGRISRSSYCWRVQALLIIPFLAVMASRQIFNAYIMGTSYVVNAMGFRNIFSFVLLIIFILCFLTLIIPTTKRLRDVGTSPWVSLLLFIPFVNLGVVIFLLLKQGNLFTNRFGLVPEKHVLTRVFSVALFPLTIYVMYSMFYRFWNL